MNFDVRENDFDSDFDVLSIEFVDASTGVALDLADLDLDGHLEAESNGGLTFYPSGTFVDGVFQYRAFDGFEYSEIATVTITMLDPVDATAPTLLAGDDYYSLGGLPELSAPSWDDFIPGQPYKPISLNDSTISDSVVFQLVSEMDPSVGDLLFSELDGSFTFAPSPTNGDDLVSFQYTISSADSISEPATVFISLQNRAPTGVDATYSLFHNETIDVAGDSNQSLFSLASDLDGDSLTIVPESQPPSDVFAYDVDGGFTYFPKQGVAVNDAFHYRLFDGQDTSELLSLTFDVGDARPIAIDETKVGLVNEPIAATVPQIVSEDGDLATAVNAGGPHHGTVVWAEDGSFTYTPDDGFAGTDSISCLLYTSPSPRDQRGSRMPSSA